MIKPQLNGQLTLSQFYLNALQLLENDPVSLSGHLEQVQSQSNQLNQYEEMSDIVASLDRLALRRMNGAVGDSDQIQLLQEKHQQELHRSQQEHDKAVR